MFQGIISSGITYYVQGLVMKTKGPVFVTAFNPLCMVIVAALGSLILAEELHLGRYSQVQPQNPTLNFSPTPLLWTQIVNLFFKLIYDLITLHQYHWSHHHRCRPLLGGVGQKQGSFQPSTINNRRKDRSLPAAHFGDWEHQVGDWGK